MVFGERIKELRIEKQWTQDYVCSKLNISAGALSRYETSMYEPKSLELVKDFANLFGVSTDYLLGKTNERNTIKDISNKLYMAPVYGQISAGTPNWAEECIEGRLPIDPSLMDIVDPEECFFLRVNGESMNKIISNGSYALIRKTDWVENGEIAVVLVNGYDATLKKFNKQNDVIVLEPMSNDSSFQVQIYDKNTPIKVIGKYIGKFEMQ